MHELLKELIPNITSEQSEKFQIYFEMLTDWNTRVNLTAITERGEVATKHFADSLLPMELIKPGARVVDVGTGAGFPGVPLLIMRPDIKLTLVDSLNKRIVFLDALIEKLGLHAVTIHARAEDAAKETGLRGSFDIALSRAVAQLNVLMEYTTPFLRVGGSSLMYKGPSVSDELTASQNAQKLLNVTCDVMRYSPSWGERTVVIAKKNADTQGKYPRRSAEIKKRPL